MSHKSADRVWWFGFAVALGGACALDDIGALWGTMISLVGLAISLSPWVLTLWRAGRVGGEKEPQK